MKEQIKSIMRSGLYGRYDAEDKTASEIDKAMKEHYFDFMEWVFKMEGFYAGLSDRYLSILNDEAKFNSLDELYQYWKDQILKGE